MGESLSPATIARLEEARVRQNEYQPSETVARVIGEKALLMFVGPSAIGKTYIMNTIAEMDNAFGRVPVFTTRDARNDDDPDMFRHFPFTDQSVNGLIDGFEAVDSTVVQYAVHPTNHHIYGTVVTDYPSEYNMLATLASAVPGLRRLPFQKTHVIGMVTEGGLWAHRFTERFPEDTKERGDRLREARSSLQWLLQQYQDDPASVHWIYNSREPHLAAQSVIDYVKSGKRDEAEQQALSQKAEDILFSAGTMSPYVNEARAQRLKESEATS